MARVRRLKAELEARPADELPLVVGPRIFIRFFLLDSLLGEEFEPRCAARGSGTSAPTTAALSVFARGETGDPAGNRGSRLDLLQLDGAAVGPAVTVRGGSSGETCHCSLTMRPRRRRDRAVEQRVVGLPHPGVEPLPHLGEVGCARAGSAARLLASAGSRTRS